MMEGPTLPEKKSSSPESLHGPHRSRRGLRRQVSSYGPRGKSVDRRGQTSVPANVPEHPVQSIAQDMLYPMSGVESENSQFRIRDECTVFVAELLCLNFIVKWNTEQNSVITEYFICTDSLSSLDSLKCISSSNNIIVEIQKQLKSLRDKSTSIDFAFVRGHTGVLGNERAGWLAEAETKRKIDIDVNIPKCFTRRSRKKKW
ncbi:RNase H domain-containing protein [Trichonephila clavipes]|nr:RNase H domain-containing protein [Trichonephila clavipes]